MDNVHSINGSKLESHHPIFNGELRQVISESIGEEKVAQLETALCEHLVLKLRVLGTFIGCFLAEKIFSKAE